MSHFSLLVISDEKITEGSLKETLQPWHEYGCDCIEDQYVIDVDVTDKVLKEFNKPQKVVILNPFDTEQQIFSRWDDRFYTKKPDPKDRFAYRNEFELPEGVEEKEISAEEARQYGIGPATMLQCAEEYYGEATQVGDRFFHKDNPNHKWDWWQVGGRWTGMFRPNYDPNTDPKNQEVCWLCQGTGKRKDMVCENGCNGCGGTGVATKWPTDWRSVGDIAQVKDIPFEALRTEAELKALVKYEHAHKIIAGRKIPNWGKMLSDNFGDAEKTRNDFYSDPIISELRAAKIDDVLWDAPGFFDMLRKSRSEVAARARTQAVQTFAVVKDGKWYQRGEMGWFGCVSDEKDLEQWSREFSTLLNSLDPETWVAVVDCHT